MREEGKGVPREGQNGSFEIELASRTPALLARKCLHTELGPQLVIGTSALEIQFCARAFGDPAKAGQVVPRSGG